MLRLAPLIILLSAFALRAAQAYMLVNGVGARNCAEMLMTPDAKRPSAGWVMGYWTARNEARQSAEAGSGMVGSTMSFTEILDVVTIVCGATPSARLVDAASAAFRIEAEDGK